MKQQELLGFLNSFLNPVLDSVGLQGCKNWPMFSHQQLNSQDVCIPGLEVEEASSL